jgi:nucleoside-diphosphate-sugar epimerase
MEKILITGGCGYIGTNLVNFFLKQNHKVTVIDTQWFGNFLPKSKNLEVIKLDLRNIKKVLLKNFSTVIHLASISNDPSSDLNPKLAWEIGPLATYELLELSRKKKIKNFIYASSGSVYGISKKNRVDEKTSKLPLSDYNKQKMVTEKVIETYSKDFRTVIFRPATVCGLSKRLRLDVSVNLLTYQAFKNNEITVLGGKQIRPNIHIDDMVSLYNFAIKNKNLNGIYNAGFENISILDIAKKISKITGCKISIKKSNDPRSYRLDSSKIISKGFKPRKNVDTAIYELISFFKKKNFKKTYKNINLELMQKIKVK